MTKNRSLGSLPSIALLSAFAVFLELFRIWHTSKITYIFLFWNLFLAWMPLFLAVGMYAGHSVGKGKWGNFIVLPTGLLWLLFFPNAPYIITDLVHLKPRLGMPYWYDEVMMFAFVLSGLMAGFASLQIVQRLLRETLGWAASWLAVAGVSLLSGLGIYMGRYLRLNSWDAWQQPQALLEQMAHQLANPMLHLRAYGVTLVFGAFLFVSYLVFSGLGRPVSQRP